jgi:phosphotransferase system  glucose/maltose/N-acetylglucosamine-specific IIC component
VYSIGSPTGTMIGVIIAAILGIYLEKIFSKWIKGQLAYALIPICIVISLMITSLFIIIPISGYIIFALS